MSTLEVILSILTLLLGGGNLAQLIQVRNLRRKGSAEAYQTEINSLRLIIQSNMEEISRLNHNYAELQEKYFALAEELQNIKRTVGNGDE